MKRKQVHGFSIHFNGPWEYAFDSQVERNREVRKAKKLFLALAKELELIPGQDYFFTAASGPKPVKRNFFAVRGGRK